MGVLPAVVSSSNDFQLVLTSTAKQLLTIIMADQVAVKRILQDLIKREDLKNKTCVDCSNPNPQWASLRFDRNSILCVKLY